MVKELTPETYDKDGKPLHGPLGRDAIILVNRCDQCCSLTYYEQAEFKRTERVSAPCSHCGHVTVKRFYQYQRRAYEVEVPQPKD